MDAIAVELTREHLWEVSVPDLIGLCGQGDPVRLLVSVNGVKEAQLHLGSMLGEERKIHALTIPRGPEWIRVSRPHAHSFAS
jgi:hypothetical protein